MIYYVSNAGSDSNTGEISSPFLTIDYAILAASNGDTITLQNIITTTTTIVVNKEITLTGGEINKTTVGDAVLISSSNVTIDSVTITMPVADTANACINISRESIGDTLPANYQNITITNNILKMSKYAILANGTNINISDNIFTRTGGTTVLSCVLVYQINGFTFNNNTINDTLMHSRVLYFTKNGTIGSTYYNECNYKTGSIVINNNTCNCTSAVLGMNFVYFDSYIGSNLTVLCSFNTNLGSIIVTKIFVIYIGSSTDLDIFSSVTCSDNYQFLTSRGAIVLEGIGAPITLTNLDRPIFSSYGNLSPDFNLYNLHSGTIDFSQLISVVLPPDLYLSPCVNLNRPVIGGDPHITDINGTKTLLPNEWLLFRLYEDNRYIVTAKAEFIGNWLLGHQLHKLNNEEVNLNKDLYVTNYTYMTEVTIASKFNPDKKLEIDTIEGYIISDNSDVIYSTNNTSKMWSVSHNVYYEPKNLISFDILLDYDVLQISIDNYYDDINSITLKLNSDPRDKVGELICHSDNNKLQDINDSE